ncbi:MAG: FecR domain-containing protein [Ginsengibacter sp.]
MLSARLEYLLNRYLSFKCTSEEEQELMKLVSTFNNEAELKDLIDREIKNTGAEMQLPDDVAYNMFQNILQRATPIRKIRTWKLHQAAAAAVIVGVLSLGSYFLLKTNHQKNDIAQVENFTVVKNDVGPGKSKAVLTLANGISIILDSSQNGILATQGNTEVTKLNGSLSYQNTSKSKTPETLYNTISTPNGGDYQLILADGSKVWLNAASSLRFPANFVGKERKVELIGEAYFEVAKNPAMPFKVKLNGMEVEVLGTHFNINSYADEAAIRTTLLEGSIKINRSNASNLLKPGQQAMLDKDGKISVINDADLDEAVAWKEGKFQFDRADIHNVMRQLARWYNVEVEYKGTVASHFGGTIARDVNLSKVLGMLHLTGEVKFQVLDKKVIVMP